MVPISNNPMQEGLGSAGGTGLSLSHWAEVLGHLGQLRNHFPVCGWWPASRLEGAPGDGSSTHPGRFSLRASEQLCA